MQNKQGILMSEAEAGKAVEVEPQAHEVVLTLLTKAVMEHLLCVDNPEGKGDAKKSQALINLYSNLLVLMHIPGDSRSRTAETTLALEKKPLADFMQKLFPQRCQATSA